MNKIIAQNSLFLTGSHVVSRIIGFLYYIFLARSLSVESFGIYTFTLAFVYNFFPVADFGLERLVLKDISRDVSKAQYYFSRILPLRIILAILSIFSILLLGLILGQNTKQLFYFLLFGLAIIPYNLTFLIASIQNAREKMQYSALANLLAILFTVFWGILFTRAGLGLAYILSAFLLSYSIVFFLFFLLLKKMDLHLKPVWDFDFCKRLLSESWQFAVFMIIGVFYLRLSVVMVGLLAGAESSGVYGSSYKFIEALVLVPQAIALALFPAFSRLYLENKIKLRSVYFKFLGLLFLLSLPIFAAFWFLPDLIIKYSYGAKYLSAVAVYPALAIAVILFFLNSLPGNIIQVSEKPKDFLPFSVANFLFLLALCFYLIPKFGLIGAGWAVVGGEVFGFMINNWYVIKILKN